MTKRDKKRAKALAIELAAAISPCAICGERIKPTQLVSKCGERWRHSECREFTVVEIPVDMSRYKPRLMGVLEIRGE